MAFVGALLAAAEGTGKAVHDDRRDGAPPWMALCGTNWRTGRCVGGHALPFPKTDRRRDDHERDDGDGQDHCQRSDENRGGGSRPCAAKVDEPHRSQQNCPVRRARRLDRAEPRAGTVHPTHQPCD
jgi:hypothetical protein